MSHTPGPWKWLGEPGKRGTLNSASGEVIEHAPYEGMWFARYNAEEDAANARLIAAAPELFVALKALTSNPHLDLGDETYQVREREGLGWEGPSVKAWSDAVSAARAALAKAEGK